MLKINHYCFFILLVFVVNSKAQNQIAGEVTIGANQSIASDPNNIFLDSYYPSVVFSLPYYKQMPGYKLVFMPQLQGIGYGVKTTFVEGFSNIDTQQWFLNLSVGVAKGFRIKKFELTPEITIGIAGNISGWFDDKYSATDSSNTSYFYTGNSTDTLNIYSGSAKKTTYFNPNINIGLTVRKNLHKNVYFYLKPRAIIGFNKIMKHRYVYQDFEHNISGIAHYHSRGNIFGLTLGVGFLLNNKF